MILTTMQKLKCEEVGTAARAVVLVENNEKALELYESFIKFNQTIDDWLQYGETIRRTIWRETKLPVGVGFGTTPTLAKAANNAEKK